MSQEEVKRRCEFLCSGFQRVCELTQKSEGCRNSLEYDKLKLEFDSIWSQVFGNDGTTDYKDILVKLSNLEGDLAGFIKKTMEDFEASKQSRDRSETDRTNAFLKTGVSVGMMLACGGESSTGEILKTAGIGLAEGLGYHWMASLSDDEMMELRKFYRGLVNRRIEIQALRRKMARRRSQQMSRRNDRNHHFPTRREFSEDDAMEFALRMSRIQFEHEQMELAKKNSLADMSGTSMMSDE